MNAPALAALKLGTSGLNEPIVGGALIFAFAGLGLLYLGWVREEMDPGIMLKLGGFVMFGFAVLALLWPYRPWPH